MDREQAKCKCYQVFVAEDNLVKHINPKCPIHGDAGHRRISDLKVRSS